MPAQAKYQILIPTHDNLGQKLGDIASAAHHWLWYTAPGIQGSYVEPPVRGNWRDDPQETFERLTTYAHETPEVESHVKQLAAHVGDVANQWGVFVTKEGKDGIQSWVINNANHVPGQGADPGVLERPPVDTNEIGLAPQPAPVVSSGRVARFVGG
jgi:hypothetical protein